MSYGITTINIIIICDRDFVPVTGPHWTGILIEGVGLGRRQFTS